MSGWVNLDLIAERGGPEAVLDQCVRDGVWIGFWTARPKIDLDWRPAWHATAPPLHVRAMRIGGDLLLAIGKAEWKTDRLLAGGTGYVMLDEPYGPMLFSFDFGGRMRAVVGTFAIDFGEQPALDLTGL